MKKIVQNTGLRQLTGDDLLLLQKQALMMESFYQQFGDFIFYGCEKQGNIYTPGLLMMNGRYTTFEGYNIPDGQEGNQLFVKHQIITENVPYKITNTDVGYSTLLAVPCNEGDEAAICIDTLAKEPLVKHIDDTKKELEKKADKTEIPIIKDSEVSVSKLWSSQKIKDYVQASEAGMLTYKGQVADIAALNAITGQKVGDTYNVIGDGNGANFTWNGTAWDELGMHIVVDNSPIQNSKNPVSSGGVLDKLKEVMPAGTIVMWSGAINAIPAGWALCNGSNGTPNLMDRFIVGAGSGYNVGSIGGEAVHTLTQNEMPVHSHSMSGAGGHNHQSSVGFGSGGGGAANGLTLTNNGRYEQYTFGSSWVGDHAHTIYNAGAGWAHENRPPYYALAYIMKLPY